MRGRQGQQGHGRCCGEGPTANPFGRMCLLQLLRVLSQSQLEEGINPGHTGGAAATLSLLFTNLSRETRRAQPAAGLHSHVAEGSSSLGAGTRLRPLTQVGAVLWQVPGRSANGALLDPETLSPVLSWGRSLKGHPGTSDPTQRSRSQTALSSGQEGLLQLGTWGTVAAC